MRHFGTLNQWRYCRTSPSLSVSHDVFTHCQKSASGCPATAYRWF